MIKEKTSKYINKKNIKSICINLIVTYAFFCWLIYFLPQWFLYSPDNNEVVVENAQANGYRATEVEYKSADGTPLFAWFTKPNDNKNIIVFMHGNASNIEGFYFKIVPFYNAGYGTFIPEFRGFSNIEGKITEKNMVADAIASIKYLHSKGYKNENIVLYGFSLGSYMATKSVYELGQENHFAGLILEVPFDSILNTAKEIMPIYFPFDYLIQDKYDNLAMIDKINTRLLIMGGAKDNTIPVHLAKNLYNHAIQPKEIIIYEKGGHGDLYGLRNYNDILTWLKK